MTEPLPAAHPTASRAPGSGAARSGSWSFLALAYGASWAWLLAALALGESVTPGRGWPTHLPALLGPLLAAVVVSYAQAGRSGLLDLRRRMLRVRAPVRWWLMALSPLLLLACFLAAAGALDARAPDWRDLAVFNGVTDRLGPLWVLAILVLVNGLGEETGWRGCLQPLLARCFGPLTTALLVAACWAAWHAPMFALVATFRSFSAPLVAGWLVGLVCGAVVLGWLYNRTGSILLVAVWHGAYNWISGSEASSGLLAALATSGVIALAAVLILLELRAARAGRSSVLGPPAT